MDLREVQISEIKNINLIYIFTTDNILRGKSEKYIGAKVVFDNNRTLSLDYKDPYFEKFIRRLIERYNKEKDNRKIILLGDLTKKIITDELFESLGSIEEKKTTGLSLFDTKNFELKKYESYFFDTLENILHIVKGYEVVKIDKIDGYNNKFIIYYHVGTVELEMRIIISFRDSNHIDFRIGYVDGVDLNIKGTIENNIDNVLITWKSQSIGLNGYTSYNSITKETEKRIYDENQTIYASEESETIIDTDNEIIQFYLNIFNIPILKQMLKTSDNNYILGEEEIINHVDTEIFYKRAGVQLSITSSSVLIRYQIINGLSKYRNQINVTLSNNLVEINLSKIIVDKQECILVEQKNTNEFGVTYDYKVFEINDFDFTKPINISDVITIEDDVNSIHDIKTYIKKKKENR